MAYIIEFEPYIGSSENDALLGEIEQKIQDKVSLTSDEAAFFLDNINYMTREKISPDLLYFKNKCDLAQAIEHYYFEDLGIESIPNSTLQSITKQIVGHNFLIIKLLVAGEEKLYLVDPTYIQFFYADACTYQSYYISPLSPDTIILTPDLGFFIREGQKGMAKFLLDMVIVN